MAILDRNYTDVPTLVQKYLKQLNWLILRLKQNRPKKGVPDVVWMTAFAKATKLVCDMQREDRQTKAANKAEEMSDKELIEALTPILLDAGWRKPLKKDR